VHRHSWSERVDYLRGVGDWQVDAGPGSGRRWTRQIVFVKSQMPAGPSYFVFRDSVDAPGAPVSPPDAAESDAGSPPGVSGAARGTSGPDASPGWWWFLRTPGEAERVTSDPGGFTYRSPWAAILDVRLFASAVPPIESRTAVAQGDLVGHVARAWVGTGSPVLKDDGGLVRVEDSLTVTAVGPMASGQPLLAVLTPRRPDEVPPVVERLGDVGVRVTTRHGTDYVFVSTGPGVTRAGPVTFEGTVGVVGVTDRDVHLVIAEGPGTVTYGGVTLRAERPTVRTVSRSEAATGQTIVVPGQAPTISFELDPVEGPIAPVSPGVWRQVRPNGIAWQFRADAPITVADGGVVFTGRRGGLAIDSRAGTVHAVLEDGERIGHGGLVADIASGPYEVTFHADRVTGRSDGPARLLHVTMPAGLDGMPSVVVGGIPYAPGRDGRVAIVALREGPHAFALERLSQPPVFRSWRWW
jgi:hypothetical protein